MNGRQVVGRCSHSVRPPPDRQRRLGGAQSDFTHTARTRHSGRENCVSANGGKALGNLSLRCVGRRSSRRPELPLTYWQVTSARVAEQPLTVKLTLDCQRSAGRASLWASRRHAASVQHIGVDHSHAHIQVAGQLPPRYEGRKTRRTDG